MFLNDYCFANAIITSNISWGVHHAMAACTMLEFSYL
jgi:hypothetical protein